MRKILYGVLVFTLAFIVISISFVQTSKTKHVFAKYTEEEANILGESTQMNVDYTFGYPGKVAPDNNMWVFKAIRDRIAYQMTLDPIKKAEMALIFADKRIQFSKQLFQKEKSELALSTLTKGEKYLEEASNQIKIAETKKMDTAPFLRKLALASLKHRIEIDEMLKIAPESAKPEIIKTQDYPKNVYKQCRDNLNSKAVEAPKNPYDR